MQRQRVRSDRGGGRKDCASNGEAEIEINIYPHIVTHIYRHTHIQLHICVCVFNPFTDQKAMLVNDLVGSPFSIPTEFRSIYGVWT